ncbi:MAG TPA: TMAO reductase system protein TorT [Methylomirabilota bacterium]|jgi:ABC-type sugar transport system substrate-binding protein|nr:TMAO reductase system protein TorT [Methylomirabilota bacterium]
MRRILTAWIGVAALALVAGAGLAAEEPIKRPPKPAKSYRIGVLEPNMAIPHFVAQAYGFVDEAEKLGAKVILYDAGEHKNVAKQVSQMEDLIANKVDAICIVPGTTATAVAQIDQALAAGIPVVNVNIMSDNPKVLGRIRSDDYELGRLQGEYIVKGLRGQGNVVMISGVSGNSAFILRAKGFKEYVAKHPGIKVLSEQWTPNATDKGLKLMEDWSQAFPKIDAVYSGGDRLTIGAVQALLAQGKKPGQVIVTTVDYNDDTEKLVREGWISAAMVQVPVTMGRWGIRVAILALEKKPIPDKLFTPIFVVTKETADQVDITAVRQPKGWRPPM